MRNWFSPFFLSPCQNGNMENPYCNGIEGILEAYHQSLRTVQLYGPTNFAPVVNHVARWASVQLVKSFFFFGCIKVAEQQGQTVVSESIWESIFAFYVTLYIVKIQTVHGSSWFLCCCFFSIIRIKDVQRESVIRCDGNLMWNLNSYHCGLLCRCVSSYMNSVSVCIAGLFINTNNRLISPYKDVFFLFPPPSTLCL